MKPRSLTLRANEVPRFLRPSGLVVSPLDKRFEAINIGPSVQFTHLAFHSGTIGIERLCKEYCPLGGPGSQWVGREPWAVSIGYDSYRSSVLTHHVGAVAYAAGGATVNGVASDFDFEGGRERGKWRSSVHMPDWAARIRKTTTRVELRRVKTITEAEAIHAGISQGGCFNCGGNQPCGCERPEPSCRETWVREFLARYGEAWHRDDYAWFVFYTDTLPTTTDNQAKGCDMDAEQVRRFDAESWVCVHCRPHSDVVQVTSNLADEDVADAYAAWITETNGHVFKVCKAGVLVAALKLIKT